MKHPKTFTLSQIFQIFSEQDLQFLQTHSKLIKLKHGQPLFLTGDKAHALYAVMSGCLKNTRETQDGHSFITRIVGPGKLVGLRELFTDFIYHRTSIALQDSVVLAIHQDAILSLIKKNPNVGLYFIKLFSYELTRMENTLESHLSKSAKTRLASIIYEFYQMFTKKSSNTFESPLQRKDIAELAGMTPETVSRSLRELKKEKILQITGKRFTILDAHALLNYAYHD